MTKSPQSKGEQAKKKVAVLGAGSWGTALAHQLQRGDSEVVLWGRDKSVIDSINKHQVNNQYFPDEKLAKGILATSDAGEALAQADAVVFAIPSSSTRSVAKSLAKLIPKDAIIVSTAKGLEVDSSKTMIGVLEEELGGSDRITVLAGPSFALEVVRNLPTAVTLAAKSEKTGKAAASFFHHGRFRVYTSLDPIGVEIGGVVKNVIALAAGAVDGFQLGSNARAALITRGIAEMQRLVVAMGGDRRTVSGLSGLGDLLLTTTGDLSRNRQVGLRLGRGEKLEDIIESLGQVAEGVKTSPVLRELAIKHKVEAPIITAIDKTLKGECSAMEALETLLARQQKPELLDIF